jgi:glucan biosynthesis protein C
MENFGMETSKITSTINLAAVQTEKVAGKRLLFIDNLRWLMIVFVVIMHLNVTYSGFGSWYYVEKRPLDAFSFTLFGMYGSYTQAYFMGFLFLIAGYFVPGAYDKKGPGKFIADRMFRLGIPTLFYMLLIEPLNSLVRWSFDHTVPTNMLSQYWDYISNFYFLGASGPLWFAFALLIFSVLYALVRLAFPKNKAVNQNDQPVSITHGQVIAVGLVISVCAFLIRLVQPIGTSFYNMQLCYFSQYIILFILGIIAYHRNVFMNIPYEFGVTWFRTALWVGIPFWSVMMFAGGVFNGMTRFNGGVYWQSVAYAFWESFFSIGVCLGLLVLFREKYNVQGRLAKFLSGNAFAVYVFHAPILIAASLMAQGIMIYPLLKMVLMVIIVLPICFGFSWLIRKVSWVRKIFS